MRDGWQNKQLKDIAGYFIGLTYSPKDISDKGIIVLRSSNVQDNELDLSDLVRVTRHVKEVLKVRQGDILMCSRNGSKRLVGKTAVIGAIPENMTFGTFMTIIRSEYNAYLSYFFRSDVFRQQIGVGEHTMINQITKYMLDAICVPLPPLSEQKHIVAILDEAFQGIATAVANAEKNLANARELFDSYLNSAYSQRGEGWRDKTVGELADHSLGKMLDRQKNKGVPKPYLRNLNVRWFEFDLSDLLHMPFEEDEQERYTAVKDDVLICEGGYPGRAAIWEDETPVFFQKSIHRVRFKDKSYNKWFLYFLYMSDAGDRLHQYFTGSGIQHFTGQSLDRFVLPVPPMPAVLRFVEQFDYLFEQTKILESTYRQKLDALAELKQAILQKAFTGELTARSVNAVQEAAE